MLALASVPWTPRTERLIGRGASAVERILVRQRLAEDRVTEDYQKFSCSLLSDRPRGGSQASQVLDGLHQRLVGIAEADLGLPRRFRKEK